MVLPPVVYGIHSSKWSTKISTDQSSGISSGKREISIKHLPVNLFASVMGISGLALAWRLAARQFGTSALVAEAISVVAVAVFLLVAIAYIAKIIRYPQAVANEFNHPVAGNFFGTVTVAVLSISSVVAPASQMLRQVLWVIGAIGTIALAFTIVSRLFRGKIDSGHAVPAWLIPGVATLDIVVAGGTIPLAYARELNLFALAVGTMTSLVFFTMITSRLVHHHEKLANHMVPSLMILIAPFEVGFLAYTNYTGQVDMFAGLLFYFGLFMFFTLVFKVFRRSIPFAAGWWALSFPLAALTNAAVEYASFVQLWPIRLLSFGLLAFLSGVILVLFIRTVRTLATGHLLAGDRR